jgi:hypothetical protein
MRLLLASFLIILMAVPTRSETRPNLVPPGWTQELADAATKTRRFRSPDGHSFFKSNQTPAEANNLRSQMEALTIQPGEQITYLRRADTWMVTSGYRGNRIFYRKSNLACGGRAWHNIELLYPREQKRQMDQTVTYISHSVTKYRNDC